MIRSTLKDFGRKQNVIKPISLSSVCITEGSGQLLLISWMKNAFWCSSKRYWFRTSKVRLMRVTSSEKGHCRSAQVSPPLSASREQLIALEFLRKKPPLKLGHQIKRSGKSDERFRSSLPESCEKHHDAVPYGIPFPRAVERATVVSRYACNVLYVERKIQID